MYPEWISRAGWPGQATALLAGGLIPLAFAPFDLWPIIFVALPLWLASLEKCNAASAAWRGWLFGLGMFGVGVSWIYVSINDHSETHTAIALLLTFLFAASLALIFSLKAYLYVRFIRHKHGALLFGFPALWVLIEWLRCWFLTGFPWLLLGDSQLYSPLSGWTPVIGALGNSLLLVSSACCVHLILRDRAVQPYRYRLGLLLSLWAAGFLLQGIDWTQPAEDLPKVKLAIIQGAVPQNKKWLPDQYQPTLELYSDLSLKHLDADLIVWPETAIPRVYDRARHFIIRSSQIMKRNASTWIGGIPYRDAELNPDSGEHEWTYHNSIYSLGTGHGLYHKQRLVPFGEYVPLESWLRGLIDFFNLPMSNFRPGPGQQSPLTAKIEGQPYNIAPFICYEIVYPDFVAFNSQASQLIITISNDAWFGDSIGPKQHLRIAQMRALENGRYLVRSTNTGITALVNAKGHIVEQIPAFKAGVLASELPLMVGRTPLSYCGTRLALGIALALLALNLLGARRRD